MTVVERPPAAGAAATQMVRPHTAGKFLYAGDEKLWIRGVTYGTFRPQADGTPFLPSLVAADFERMRAVGINAIRVYEPPPRWLLDAAQEQQLRVLVGLAWEQHVTFLDDRDRARSIERRVRTAARELAGHPALLGFAVGNEIPASIVRWHGRRPIERFLERLAGGVHDEDPDALVTYVNFPTTEYLELPFADFLTFNVYLEQRDRYEAYLARLQNVAGDRPLVMAEIGLDSRRNGEQAQAAALDWQIRSSFAGGAAGTFIFAWTDEWHRGGHDIEDWDFGLVRRDRSPKPALDAVANAYDDVPFPSAVAWPRVSVVVCSYNGARTIRDCLDGLGRLNYPDYEVIVVNDGSTDATPAIAAEYNVRLISTPNRGLSSARNTGLEAATGEIVAYTDDDARPDPHWLQYVAHAFMTTDHAAIGGPNIPPPDDPPLAEAVANAPGGPLHVLIDDQLAEHIPGCNMAFRRDRLAAIGGFDPVFRAAGDDVDACWRIQQHGWTIGFHAGAMVWHHRRGSIRMYWKQQQGYGKAEALLERKWPERYNALGHLAWAGRIYGRGLTPLLRSPTRLYGGTWGSAAFQSVYQQASHAWLSLTLMPEWYLVIAGLAGLGLLGLTWTPLLAAWLLFVPATLAPILQAAIAARQARLSDQSQGMRPTIFLLHLLQPLARVRGRLAHGLSLWRLRAGPPALPLPRALTAWGEKWRSAEARLEAIEQRVKADGGAVLRGGDFDGWDLELRAGAFGSARLRLAIEEHGAARQLARARVWPVVSPVAAIAVFVLGVLAAAALVDGAGFAGTVLTLATLGAAIRLVAEPAFAIGGLTIAARESFGEEVRHDG